MSSHTANAAQLEIPEAELFQLAEDLVAAPSPNPPGDVSAPLRIAEAYLSQRGIPYSLVSPASRMYNIVATVEGRKPGPHVILNAHLDTFPAAEPENRPPVSTGIDVPDTGLAVRGLGASDMKGGAAAFMVILGALARHQTSFVGRVTLCLVCDEETMGTHGSKALLRRDPSLRGDVMLSTEPSGLDIIEYGERGLLWGVVDFRREAGHGSMVSESRNAIEDAGNFMADLRESLPQPPVRRDDPTVPVDPVDQISLNFGRIAGGLKINMQPQLCRVGVDLRIPRQLSVRELLECVRRVSETHGGQYMAITAGEPNVSDKDHPIFSIMQQTAAEFSGQPPEVSFSLGCTDARLWRYAGTTAAVYGPDPGSMARPDEYVTREALLSITRVHATTTIRYLADGSR